MKKCINGDDHISHRSNNKTKQDNNDLRETIRQKKQTK